MEPSAVRRAAPLMLALSFAALFFNLCRNHTEASARAQELFALAEEKGSLIYWKSSGMMLQGCVLALTGKAADAVQMITSGITARRSTGATLWIPLWLS